MKLNYRCSRLKQNVKQLMCVLSVLLFIGGVSAPTGRSQAPADGVKVQAVVLILHPDGFDSSEITVAPGLTAIYVYNRVGRPELALRLDQEVSAPGPRGSTSLLALRQERVSRERLKWSDVFNLPAGTYRISEETNPKWTCTIRVTAEKQ